jgi:hypothetical protein
MAILGWLLGAGAIATLGAVLVMELNYRRRPGNCLEMSHGDWEFARMDPTHYQLVGELDIQNLSDKVEVMVPELWAETKLFSGASLANLQWTTNVTPLHEDFDARPDGYWFGYIVKTGKKTRFRINLDIQGPDLTALKSAWVKVNWVTYGPGGHIPKTRHVVIPLKFPNADAEIKWRETPVSQIRAIPTHLLTELDKPVDMVKRYVSPHAKPGDVVTIGESPIAIMQGRFRHPNDVKIGWVAKRVCQFFLPTSSLATAGGMQTLVDLIGPARTLFAFFGGIALRFVGIRGGFYILGGYEARLIDDVTGTLAPYDQFVVLGPEDPQGVVDEIKRETGLSAAIVDVNDLGAVKVLAASPGVTQEFLEGSLKKNPAGNADEQTPIVLLRPKDA